MFHIPLQIQQQDKTAKYFLSLFQQQSFIGSASKKDACNAMKDLTSLYLFIKKRLSRKLLRASAPSVRNNSKAAHFLGTHRQGSSMVQLGLLRALRQEGSPLVPRGQTTPYCCPTGHKMSGKGSAQMEDCVCQCFPRHDS